MRPKESEQRRMARPRHQEGRAGPPVDEAGLGDGHKVQDMPIGHPARGIGGAAAGEVWARDIIVVVTFY